MARRWCDRTKKRGRFGNREEVGEFRTKVRRNGSKNRIGRIGRFGEAGRMFRGAEEEAVAEVEEETKTETE